MKEVGYSVICRQFVGDEETTRDTRTITCSSLEDFKKKMQKHATRSYDRGKNDWKLEAPQIFESTFKCLTNEEIEILHYTEFCDMLPLLKWKERVCDFSRFYRLKRGEQ